MAVRVWPGCARQSLFGLLIGVTGMALHGMALLRRDACCGSGGEDFLLHCVQLYCSMLAYYYFNTEW